MPYKKLIKLYTDRKHPIINMKLESQLLFYDQVHIDIYKIENNQRVETAVFAGTNYHKTLLSLTNQIGCMVGCDFCYGKSNKFYRNITADEYLQQVTGALETNPSVIWYDPKRPIKVGFQRAGEALLNKNFFSGLEKIAEKYKPGFQLTSVMPNSNISYEQLSLMEQYLSKYQNSFQINVSMHTSDEKKRKSMMNNFSHLMDFKQIAEFGEKWVKKINQRKINLSFVLMEDNEVDFDVIKGLFKPEYFSIRFAFYLPSSEETKQKHAPSNRERMNQKANEARNKGFHVIESAAGPVEQMWDTRPFSALKMLRDNI